MGDPGDHRQVLQEPQTGHAGVEVPGEKIEVVEAGGVGDLGGGEELLEGSGDALHGVVGDEVTGEGKQLFQRDLALRVENRGLLSLDLRWDDGEPRLGPLTSFITGRGGVCRE